MYGLKGKGCGEGDCCAHTCCFGLSHCCAQCQEVREIEFRKHALNTTQRQAQQAAAAAPPSPYGQPGQPNPYAQQYGQQQYGQPSSPNGNQGPVNITIHHSNSGGAELQGQGSGFQQQPQLLLSNSQLVRLPSGQMVMVSPVNESPQMGGQNVQMAQVLEMPQVENSTAAAPPPKQRILY